MLARPLTFLAPGWLDPGRRVYAIGDIHGCADRLDMLYQQIAADLARDPAPHPLLVHLGDYVDRGPDSARVVRRLAAGPVLPGVPMVCLRGNHEQMLLDALRERRTAAVHWLRNGGTATLESWGADPAAAVTTWRDAMAPELPFLAALPCFHALDGYLFVHAGVRPGLELDRQTEDDMLWIREPFLNWRGVLLPDSMDVAVVHGHTPSREPEIGGPRIGIDTGAVMGGRLTCAVLENRTVRFIQA